MSGFTFPWVTLENLAGLLRAALLLFLAIPILMAASRAVRGWVEKKYSPQQGMVAGKVILYPGLVLIFISVLQELGFSLAPLLGAAGIVGIAVGFASQTSVSNVISGFFLIGERPFEVDDLIQVGDTTGRVMSIDTLSVKLRTPDNRFVRIPNETIVKSQVTTITRFPIRRLDLSVGVAYREDIGRVQKVLLEVARANPRALMEPAPNLFVDGYGESSVDLRLAVWTVRESFLALKTELLREIKERFDSEGIEIPFPHRTLYVGSESDPFRVRMGPAGTDLREASGPTPITPEDPAGDEAAHAPDNPTEQDPSAPPPQR